MDVAAPRRAPCESRHSDRVTANKLRRHAATSKADRVRCERNFAHVFFQIPALRPDALFSENVRNDEPILLRHDVGRVQQQTLASFFDTFPYLAEAACSLSLSPVLVNVRPVDIAVPHRYSTTTP